MAILDSLLYAISYAFGGLVVLRLVLSWKSIVVWLSKCWGWLDEHAHVYQHYRIPRFVDDGGVQENPLHRKALAYLSSLPTLEESDAADLFSSARKTNDFHLGLSPGQSARDFYLGARLKWSVEKDDNLVLRVRRHDRRRALRPYLQHVESVAEEIELRRRDLRLFSHSSGPSPKWRCVQFTHPATLDAVVMDQDIKNRVRGDLESFLKGRAYYHRLGRVWRRSYLLHGSHGTGKSSFVAAMANFLCYDVYDLDLSRATDADDLRALLIQTKPRSVILVEDLDRYLAAAAGDEAAARLLGLLNFMDGIFSCCGEERVMVFTMGGGVTKDGGGLIAGIEPAVVRPGRVDVYVHFPMCDFTAFKTLASSYLGLKDHKLYPQVEEVFLNGGKLSPAEVGEIMIAHRGSPSRALKSVISALQSSAGARLGVSLRRLSESSSVDGRGSSAVEAVSASDISCGTGVGIGFGKDATLREFRKLYGFIRRNGSKREGAVMPIEEAAVAAAAANSGGEKESSSDMQK